MAYYRRSRSTSARRTARGYSRRSSGRSSSYSGRARRTTRRSGARPQAIRIVIENGQSSMVQRPDGMMAVRTQPENGGARF